MSSLTRDRLYHYAVGVGGAEAKTHAVCPACHRGVRIRKDGRLFKHLAKPATGGVQCSNRQRGDA